MRTAKKVRPSVSKIAANGPKVPLKLMLSQPLDRNFGSRAPTKAKSRPTYRITPRIMEPITASGMLRLGFCDSAPSWIACSNPR